MYQLCSTGQTLISYGSDYFRNQSNKCEQVVFKPVPVTWAKLCYVSKVTAFLIQQVSI